MVTRQGQAATSRKGATAEHWKQHSHDGNDCRRKAKTRLNNQPAAITIATTASGICYGIGPQCSDAAKTTMAKLATIKNDNKEKQQSKGTRHNDKWQGYSQR